MMNLHPKYLSGLVAVVIYFGIIGLVFFYFGYRTEKRSTHFVAKNSNAIAVTLQTSKTIKKSQNKSAKFKPKKFKHTKLKPMISKRHVKPKPTQSSKKKPVKKIKAKSLFSNIKSKPKHKPKNTKITNKAKRATKNGKASKLSRDALAKQQAKDKGIENRYLASVQDRLYGWPTQSNFAGATFTIGLTIHPSGRFEYVVLQPSDNTEFNRTIEQYLRQLQGIGFDPTPQRKTLEFKVEIVAK
jgi:hypothetical protein